MIERLFSVFAVKNGRKFVDKDANIYPDFEDYQNNNRLPRGPMLFPCNGSYTPPGGDGGGVPLSSGETPPAASVIKRIRAVTDTVAMVGGMVLSVTGVVAFFAPGAFSQAVKTAMDVGSFILSTYTIAG